jgi:hypothetical protein
MTGLEQMASTTSQLDDTKNALIKMMIYICKNIEDANKRCLICHETLEEPSIKVRPCTKDACEFTFEESFKVGLLSELKYFTHESLFDLSMAAKSLLSSRANQVFVPFPSFFLKHQEICGKRGNLDEIKKA